MQKKIKIIILAIVLLYGFCLVRDFFIKSLIGTVAGNVTGAPTQVGGLSLSIIGQSIKISNFKMYNPQGFPKDVLVDIPKMRVAWDLGALLSGKIHLRKIDFELKELTMAKNKEGALNVDSLKVTQTQKTKAEETKKPAKEMAIQIDVADLAIGRIISKDYSVSPTAISVYDVNLKKNYKDINSVQQLAALIISEPLKAAGIQGLKVYAASLLTGMAALPVSAAFTFTGKDHAQASFNVRMEKAYDAGLQLLKQIGTVKKEDKAAGTINGEVNGTAVTYKVKELDARKTEVTVSARKIALPKPEVAAGVIYQLTEELK